MYYLYYIVLFISLDLCAAYYDYFSALTQILRPPCNTNEIGGSRRFLLPTAYQEPTVALPIRFLLPLIHPPLSRTVWSVSSDLSGQSDP